MTTKPCPRCGSAVPSEARFCGSCGHTFVATTVDEATADPPRVAPAPPPPSRPHAATMTMVGHPGLAMPSQRPTPMVPPPAEPAPAPGFMQTVADPEVAARAQKMRDDALREAAAREPGGAKTAVFAAVAVPAFVPNADTTLFEGSPPPGMPPAPPEPKRAFAGTMLGMPAVAAPAKEAPPPPVSNSFKTMVGVAMPGIAPSHERPPESAAASRPLGTLVGIAAPGIAPLRPGEPAAPAAMAAPVPIVPAPAPLVQEPLPEAPRRPVKGGIPAVLVVAIVFAIVAVAGTVGAVLVLRSGAALAAQPQLDETGKESLKIRCESCPDGTTITLGASSSKVVAFATVLPLPVPLRIGDNDLSMAIDRPGSGRDETVKVHVPVAYRVKADLSTLTASPATITVRVESSKDTEVMVDGKVVPLDAAGKGAHTLDVSSEVEGPSDEQRAIDKKIAFTIKAKNGSQETGQLVVRTGVAPLHLDAPGVELYTDRATGNVAGQIKPGGALTIDGQPAPVDAQGRFGIGVELPAEGEKTLTIVASGPPLAPRTVRAKLVRVADLAAAAKTLDAKSPLGWDAYGADPKAKIGQLAVVDGEVVDVRVAQGHTVLAIEEKKGCAASPCAVRVVHGEEIRAARGDLVRAYGRIEGTATLNGKTIPDVEGALVIVTAPVKPRRK